MDCLEYLRLIPDDFVDLVVTDPPYTISLEKNFRFDGRVIVKDFGEWDKTFNPEPILKELKRVLKPNGQIYIFCATKQIPEYMNLFKEQGWMFRNLLVWYKTNPVPRLCKNNYLFANEYILYAVNKPNQLRNITFNFSSQNSMHNTIIRPIVQGKERIKDEQGKTLHPTQKPLDILKKLIETSSKEGNIVLDPFMGVGSTAVAARELKRNYLGCELQKIYYNAIVRQFLTPKKQFIK